MVKEHLAGQLRVAQLGVALHIGIERTPDATAATAAGDHDAVDIEEFRVTVPNQAKLLLSCALPLPNPTRKPARLPSRSATRKYSACS